MDNTSSLVLFFELLNGKLDERVRRLVVAAAAKSLPHGGATAVAQAAGVSRSVIYDGIKELESGGGSAGTEPSTRQRRPGAGPKFLADKDPGLLADLDSLIKPYVQGDPESCLRWTCRSLRNLSEELCRMGHTISYVSVGKLLEQMGYTLQSNRKSHEGSSSPDRDAQFLHIQNCVNVFLAESQPVISVDAKKKELIGNFKNNGREYMPKGKPTEVNVYDFINENGRATPYGVYDIASNEGFVNVGISHDTASFAADSIRRWWETMGQARYESAHSLYINADGGGSNSSRSRLWKKELQKLANDLGLNIYVSHFPPGTSKWNKIEHRMFSFISMNWRGKPLSSLEIIVNLIANTSTKSGLTIKAEVSSKMYATGEKVPDETLAAINMKKHEFHPEWNYVVIPNQQGLS
jgi:transposase